MKLPTHEEAATAFENEYPEYAEFLRSVKPDLNCWGDLVFRIQKEFPLSTVIGVYKLCQANGWEAFVTKTFCPVSEKLWAAYEELEEYQKGAVELTEAERRERNRHIFGTMAKLRVEFARERKRWMEANGLKSEDDPAFFDLIILHLEKRRVMEGL